MQVAIKVTEPTIEDLQGQISELTKSNEQMAQELEKLKTSSTETEENLRKARELNANLLLRVSAPSPDDNETEEVDDTVESLCDEIVNSTNKKIIQRYKRDN